MKLYIQAYYDNNGYMKPVMFNEEISSNINQVDSILIELHSPNAPYGLVQSQKAILQTNGNVSVNFSCVNGYYYLVLKHRNALETWSAQPVNINSGYYDFTTAASQAYGSNQQDMSGTNSLYAFYNGDINQDGNIDLYDLLLVNDDIENFIYGYYATDITGDGNVDLYDLLILENNITDFIYSAQP